MKIRTIISSLLLLSLVALVLMPGATYAKEREQRREREDRKEEKSLNKLIKKDLEKINEELEEEFEDQIKETRRIPCTPYGHFIAPGWIWRNGSTSPDDDCWLPRGIQKKWFWWGWGGWNMSSTTDTTAPIISTVRSWPLNRAAFISWITDEPSDSALFWSTTTPVSVNSSSTPQQVQNMRTRVHQMLIRGLSTSTTYYAVVRSRDAAGNAAYSPEFSFFTRGGTTTPPVVDVTAPTITTVALSASTSTMNVSWVTNELATSRVFYSTGTPVTASTSTTPYLESGTLVTNHSLNLSSLSASTTYYIRVQSADAALNIQTSGEFSTTTAGL